MLDEVVRKPNPESDWMVSYGNNNTLNYRPIETGHHYRKTEEYGPFGK